MTKRVSNPEPDSPRAPPPAGPRVLKPTTAQLEALRRILRAQGDTTSPAPLSNVSARIAMVRTLQALGWLERTGDYTIKITPAGLAILMGGK